MSTKNTAEVDALRERIKALEDFARDIADNWDCDGDGHRHNTGCRQCNARALLAPPISEAHAHLLTNPD